MSELSEIIPEDEIKAQIARILRHPEFSATAQRRAFLTYVVDETLAGRADRLKGVAIAMSVFGRDATFDQQTDPVVRQEARRLRSDLDNYYAGLGVSDPVKISIPKGGYVPRFDRTPSFIEPLQTPIQDHNPAAHRRFLPGLVVLGLCAFAFIGWLVFAPNLSLTVPEDQQVFPAGPVLAVLPFEMLGEGSQYVAEGLTQQVTNELVRFRDLWVLPLGSVSRFRREQIDPQALKDEFDADFALEGSVMESPDALRISARLIDLNTGRYIWVTSLESGRDPAEIYDAQNTITREVVGNLAGKYGLLSLSAMEVAKRRPPENRDAYDCVLRYYEYQIAIRLTQHGEVAACIDRAVELDPEYAEAWAIRSNLYLQQVRYELGGDADQTIQAAALAARRSVDLDPHSAFGQSMLSNMSHTIGDIKEFKAAGRRALELNPNSGPVLAHYGMRLAFIGEWEDGLQYVEKAITLNPVHPHWYYFPKVFHSYVNGNYDDALATLNRVDMPGFFWDPLIRAALHGQMGHHTQANAAVDELLQLKPDFAMQIPRFLDIWQFEDRFKDSIKDGLNKAGLDLTH